MGEDKFIILTPGLLVTVVTFILGTIVNSSIIFKIIQKPKCFFNYSCELNISVIGFIVCFFIGGFHISINTLIFTSSMKYPNLCGIQMSCSNGLQVAFIINLIALSYKRHKRIQAIDACQVQSQTGILCITICWIIGLLVTVIYLVTIFTHDIRTDDIGYGCEFTNQPQIKILHYILFCIFLTSVITITCTNFKILKFLKKPVVCPMSAVCPAAIPRPDGSKDGKMSSSSIQTQHLMNIPEQILGSQRLKPIIKKSSCSSNSSVCSVTINTHTTHTEISHLQRSPSIFSSAKEDDCDSDGSIYSQHLSIPMNTVSKNEIFARLNNARKMDNKKIELCKNDISKLTNCEYKQNMISMSNLTVEGSLKNNKNMDNFSQSESRITASPSLSSFSCSEYSVHYLWDDDRLCDHIIVSKNDTQISNFSGDENTYCNRKNDIEHCINDNENSINDELDSINDNEDSIHDNEDRINDNENGINDNEDCINNNDNGSDVHSYGNNVIEEVSNNDDDDDDNDSDNGGEYSSNKMEHILSRPRLQPIPIRKKLKRKFRNTHSHNRLNLSIPIRRKNKIEMDRVKSLPNLSMRRKAIVNFEHPFSGAENSNITPEIPKNKPTGQLLPTPGIRWNESMNMPVVLTRRHRMKKIVFRNLMLELVIYIIFMSFACLKNVLLSEYNNAHVIFKSFLYLTESIHLLLFAINPFLYILKNKNIMNEL